MLTAWTTAVMARTDSAAGFGSSTRPAWVDSTSLWRLSSESAAMLVLRRGPAFGAEVLGGGEHGQRATAQRREGLRLLEHRRDHRQLVPTVAHRPRGRVHGVDHRRVVGGQVGAGRDHRSEAQSCQRGQQRESATHQGVLQGVARDRGRTGGGWSCPAAPCRRPARGTARRTSSRRARRWSARPGRTVRARRPRPAGRAGPRRPSRRPGGSRRRRSSPVRRGRRRTRGWWR